MQVKYVASQDRDGKDIIKKQNFAKVKSTATEQNVFDLALEIEKVLGKTLNEVVMVQNYAVTG